MNMYASNPMCIALSIVCMHMSAGAGMSLCSTLINTGLWTQMCAGMDGWTRVQTCMSTSEHICTCALHVAINVPVLWV